MIIEACVDNLSSALVAQKGGAHQIELCSRLDLDGLSPDIADAEQIIDQLTIPVKVMIRPRAGDFVFSPAEIDEMIAEVHAFRQIGARDFVIGMATPGNQLDLIAIQQVCAEFPESAFTLHKVIDVVDNPLSYLTQLNLIPNLSSILTSGGAPTAMAGAVQIMAMHNALSKDKQVIAAGKITAGNLEEVQDLLPVGAYHGRRIIAHLD